VSQPLLDATVTVEQLAVQPVLIGHQLVGATETGLRRIAAAGRGAQIHETPALVIRELSTTGRAKRGETSLVDLRVPGPPAPVSSFLTEADRV
jgi:hypothetical protein